MADWQPIETAPIDGRPVWVRGWDWGTEGGKRHFLWAYFDGADWRPAGDEDSTLTHLTDWIETP